MKHISVLVPVGSSIVDNIIAPFNLLKMANVYLQKINRMQLPAFKIDLVGLTQEPVMYQGLFSVQPTTTIHELTKTDLIVVSPISGNLEKEIEKNMEFVNWIKAQRIENDSEIASLCKGAFLLAETGLMNGKSCATHWTAHELFKGTYPEVKLMSEKIKCEDNGI